MNDLKQTNQEDKNIQSKKIDEQKAQKTAFKDALTANKKVISIALILLLIIIIFDFLNPFSSSNDKPKPNLKVTQSTEHTIDLSTEAVSNETSKVDAVKQNSDTAKTIDENQNQSSNEIKKISPPLILNEATELASEEVTYQERVEVPGDVIDGITEQILKQQAKSMGLDNLVLNAQNVDLAQNTNEQPLGDELDADHFTVQLSGASSYDSLVLFAKQNNIYNYKIYKTVKENKPWFVLIKGDFLTREDALRAAEILPDELKTSAPWIKSGAQVNKEKSAN